MAARAHARGDAKAFDRLFAAAAIGSLSRQTDNRQTARITHGLSPRSRSRACSTTKAGERVRAARAARLACVCVEWAYLISILTYTNRLRSTQEYVYALEEVHSLTERLELPLKRRQWDGLRSRLAARSRQYVVICAAILLKAAAVQDWARAACRTCPVRLNTRKGILKA